MLPCFCSFCLQFERKKISLYVITIFTSSSVSLNNQIYYELVLVIAWVAVKTTSVALKMAKIYKAKPSEILIFNATRVVFIPNFSAIPILFPPCLFIVYYATFTSAAMPLSVANITSKICYYALLDTCQHLLLHQISQLPYDEKKFWRGSVSIRQNIFSQILAT